MSTLADSPWVVLKFGGTSVSSVPNWQNIAKVVQQRLEAGLRPVVVHSALSGITDRLELLLKKAIGQDFENTLNEIEKRHLDLALAMAIIPPEGLKRHFIDLRQIASGIALVGEISDRVRARVMATGELMATELGASYLRAQGVIVNLIDARTVLKSESRQSHGALQNVLSASCPYDADLGLQQLFLKQTGVILTQGYIAQDQDGNTVLLGRGGSDTSAAYFAAKLMARRLEIWTDVPGMFSADPRFVPTARLLKSLHYDEAQEIASNGAKVLHPRCIRPVREHAIPLYVFATQTPDAEGTVVSASPSDTSAQIKAICLKKGITLISMDSPGMWHQVGFLANTFQLFKQHHLSIDLVSTSETNVTVSLDAAANTVNENTLAALTADLQQFCKVKILGSCTSLSLVGRNIRGILYKLGEALEVFEQQKVYLVSQAANDLAFTFVIDEEPAGRLAQQLHSVLIRPPPNDKVMGPTWEQLFRSTLKPAVGKKPWWQTKRSQLLEIANKNGYIYVYDKETLSQITRKLRELKAIDKILFSVKANSNHELIQHLQQQNIGFECVSPGEVERVLTAVPGLAPQEILFTPNFSTRAELASAFKQNVRVTIDNLYALKYWGELCANHEIFVRLDPGFGCGHHEHVRTAGSYAKFGIPMFEIDELLALCEQYHVTVRGLHAHSGSGIYDYQNWLSIAELLANAARRFEQVEILNLGGGFGISYKSDQENIDFQALDQGLSEIKQQHSNLKLWIEPGRYLVARAGVLLAQVTQLKDKGDVRYVGINTGMNSLIRPALYGAYHEIVNLSQLGKPATEIMNVVGPICESGDQLGNDRLLPVTKEGDVILIADTGAYGYTMSSHYNLREPAGEIII